MENVTPSQWLDRIAVSMSSLCALHCLTLPLILILAPALSASFFGDALFHQSLLLLVIPSSLVAIGMGCKRHKDGRVWAYGASGLLVMTVAAFWGHDLVGEWGEKILTLAGAGILAAGHIRNHALCRQSHCDHQQDSCDH